MSAPLSSGVSGQNQYAVLVSKRRMRIGDEPVAVQVGDNRRTQLAASQEFAERRKACGKRIEQLAERVRLHVQFGDPCTLARNAKKLDMHDADVKIVA